MMPAIETTKTGPYGQAANAYWAAGWRGILPLPANRKKHPPTGYTGRNGMDSSYPDIAAWLDTESDGNIALRMPHNVIGLDIDDYGDKAGVGTLELHEAMHGKLPATWRSTSRDTRLGGIRFFRVPPGLEWPGELEGGGIEIIQRAHRYAVVWPSVHPEGGTYRWYDPEGNPALTMPQPEQLPELPEAWVTDLTRNQLATESSKVSVGEQAAIAWLAEQPRSQDEPCPVMAGVLEAFRASTKTAHGAMNDAILTATRHAQGQHPGAVQTIITIRKEFLAKVAERRDPQDARSEFQRSLTGAVGICIGDPIPPSCDCYGQLTAAILGEIIGPTNTPTPDPVTVEGTVMVPEPEPVPTPRSDKLKAGDTFILDAPEIAPAIWGDGENILWAKGEALILAGPPGVGKTTLVGQVVRARLGLSARVIGYPVQQTSSRVLYLAMDRPQQIARSLRRQFNESERATLADRLMVWSGPPPMDIAKNPSMLKVLAGMAGADTVIVDSLKDAAIGLVEDEVGAGYNRARQLCLADGIEVLELHHMVKRGEQGRKPNTLADVYGSMHITSGAGSVIVLWGQGGDLLIELLHLKQPMNDIGPLQLEHDHAAGATNIALGTDLLSIIAGHGQAGISVRAAASAMFQKDEEEVTKNEKLKARRQLEKLRDDGHVIEFDGPDYHGQRTFLYRTAGAFEGSREGSRPENGLRVREGSRGFENRITPSAEGSREGSEGSRVEGSHAVIPLRDDVRMQHPDRTLGNCDECGEAVPINQLKDNAWRCEDCAGAREGWYR